MKKAFLAAALMSAALHVFAQNGVIRELSGEVELRHAGALEFVPAAVGSTVAQDTVISTGFRSSAIIEVGSSTLTVRPLTRLSLTEIRSAAGAETLTANLQAGRVRVDVRPPAGTTAAFTVQGPSATASVRGTSFEFDARSVRVIEGSVTFMGDRGAPVVAQAGGESTVGAGGMAADPVQAVFENLSPPAPVGTAASGEMPIAPAVVVPLPTPVPVPTPPATGNIVITITH